MSILIRCPAYLSQAEGQSGICFLDSAFGGGVLKGALFSRVEVGFIEQSEGHLGLLGASASAFEVVFWTHVHAIYK